MVAINPQDKFAPKVIITGATGFLGQELTRLFSHHGFQVLALGRNQPKLAQLKQDYGVEAQVLDLNNIDHKPINNYYEGSDYLIHCAALSSAWGSKEQFQQENVDTTKKLMTWSLHHNIKKVIYISSTSVYFNYTNRYDIDENARIASPFSCAYAWSKYQSEQVLTNMLKQKIPYTIIRPRGIIGKGDTAILPRVLKIMDKGYFPLFNNGQALVDLTHVNNVAEAVYLATQTHQSNNQIYNISNNQPMTVRELVDHITQWKLNRHKQKVRLIKINYFVVKALAKILVFIHTRFKLNEPTITPYSTGLLAYSQTLDIKKAQQDLGYKAEFSLQDAIQDALDANDKVDECNE